MLSIEAHNFIQNELGPREQLVWAGVPRQGLALRKSDIGTIPFSIFWFGFACYWEYNVLQASGGFPLSLWGGLFVLIGGYYVAGRFFVDSWLRGRTAYGVTNERILIHTKGVFGRKLTSIDLRLCPEIRLDERNDGSGTISFGRSKPSVSHSEEQAPPKIRHRSFRLSPTPPQEIKIGDPDSELPDPAFEMIADAKNVYEIIREAQRRGE